MMFATKTVLAAALVLLAPAAFAGEAEFNGNPAAVNVAPAGKGTHVPGATGINPYSGRSVGVPLQPNDLGSRQQNAVERNLCPNGNC